MRPNIRPQRKILQLLTAAIVFGGGVLQPVVVLTQTVTTNQIRNQATYTYTDSITGEQVQGVTDIVSNSPIVANGTPDDSLIDPLGHITGCGGELLADYTGFWIGVYETNPNDPTGTELNGLVPLTRTEIPDNPDNKIPLGLAPNSENSNPFFITNGDKGAYSFLLDPNRGQLDTGRAYILVIHPPQNSIYQERRVRIVINSRNGDIISYTATSLDGKPISSTDNRASETETINIRDAARIGLVFQVLDMNADICQSQEIQIVKTGDRAAAAPGDTVIYRLSIRNLASSTLSNVVATDDLPLGFNFLPKSVRGVLGDTPVQITTTTNGSTVTFRAEGVNLAPNTATQNQVLNIAYATQLTPDAIRGDGENSASVTSQRLDNNRPVKDGPSVYKLRIDRGIISDCGTLIGRVFVDKNFDGEQQKGEPGVPNAVIFMDDGNRITTDPNGLFSVANVIAGYRTGVLDLSSLPGYTLAPNRKFSERNSQSRLVHLAPGSLARMNFAVTPTFQEAK